jgi:hypothetical protein
MKLVIVAFVFYLSVFGAVSAKAQTPFAGFDAAEYADAIDLAFRYMRDTALATPRFTLKKGSYLRLLRTPEVGLYNCAEVYLRSDGVVVVSLRGTIAKPESWLENFYAAMIPAEGSLTVNDSTTFPYKFANLPNAYVHTGWTLGLAHVAPYITRSLDSLLKAGHTNIFVTGHSQGGGLAFLTTSYLYYHYKQQYPAMQLKAYCSAAPKPGNQNYAYDFEHITRGGYGFRIINSADWVPEMPFTIQTVNDMNPANPVVNAKTSLKSQKLLARIYLNSIYNKLSRSTAKATRRYQKYLGQKLDGRVGKVLPQYEGPTYVNSSFYATAGVPIVLYADSSYQQKFVFNGKNVFVHHMAEPYQYLLKQHYPELSTAAVAGTNNK